MKVKKTTKTTIKKKNAKGKKKSEEPIVKVLNLNVNPQKNSWPSSNVLLPSGAN